MVVAEIDVYPCLVAHVRGMDLVAKCSVLMPVRLRTFRSAW